MSQINLGGSGLMVPTIALGACMGKNQMPKHKKSLKQ